MSHDSMSVKSKNIQKLMHHTWSFFLLIQKKCHFFSNLEKEWSLKTKDKFSIIQIMVIAKNYFPIHCIFLQRFFKY